MRNRNRTLLSGVSATAVTLALGTTIAMAANTSVGYVYTGPAVGFELNNATAIGNKTAGSLLENQDTISSSITAGVGVETTVDDDAASSSSATVESNTLEATSIGNQVTSEAEIEALGDGTDGIGIADASVNSRAAAAVTSAVADSSLSLNVTTLASGGDAYDNSGNVIGAASTLNSRTLVSNGAIPSAFSDTTTGGSHLNFDPSSDGVLVSSEGSIAESNVQVNSLGVSGRSSASVSNNIIGTEITPAAVGEVLSSSVTSDGNSINADYVGNTTTSQVAVTAETDGDSGVNPTFNGSVAASNVQANLEGDIGAAADVTRASNVDSNITAVVGLNEPGFNDSTLEGSLSVSGNDIGSSTVGNNSGDGTKVGTDIIVSPGISYSGSGATQASNTTFDGYGIEGNVDAGLSVQSAQANVQSSHDAITDAAFIGSTVQNLVGGSVEMSDNRIDSSASGNKATSRIITQNADDIETPSFNGTAALANAQVNTESPVSAGVSGSEFVAKIGNANITGGSSTFNNATAEVADNVSDASATGNSTENRVQLGANTLALGAGSASISGGDHENGTVSVDAGASLTNLQANHYTTVTATNTDSEVGADASAITSGASQVTLANKGNRISANAVGNDGLGNTVALQGTSVSGSAGLSSVQITGVDSDVTADTIEGLVYALTAKPSSSNANVGSKQAVEDNTISADAIANRVNNAFSLTGSNAVEVATSAVDAGTEIDIDSSATDGAVFDEDHPTVNAAFGLLNSQVLASNVSATVESSEFDNQTNYMSGSHISTTGNTLHAAALGSKATNSMTLDVGGASLAALPTDTASAAALANVQSRTDGSNIAGVISDDEDRLEFGAEVNALDLVDGSASVDSNKSEVLARGNTASNSLTAKAAASLDLFTPTPMTGISVGAANEIVNDLGFSVVNAQDSGSGSVTATQTDVQANASISDNVLGSAVSVSSNNYIAEATDNKADSSLAIDGGSAVTSGGVVNYQSSGSATSATVGAPGAFAEAGEVYNITATNIDPDTGLPVGGFSTTSNGDGTWTITSGTLFTDSDMTGVAGWTEVTGSPGWYQTTVSGYIIDAATNSSLSSPLGGSFAFNGVTGDEDGSPASASMVADVGGDLVDSAISTNENMITAKAISNTATNKVVAGGNNVTAGSGFVAPAANVDLLNGTVVAQTDFAVANSQSLDPDASASASASGTYAAEVDGLINAAQISVSGNAQQAIAEGNQAENGLSLSATNLDGSTSPTTAIVSVQTIDDGASGAISANSWMDVHANAASTNSDIDLSSNRNVALAIANDVDNGHVENGDIVGGLNVSGTNLEGSSLGDANSGIYYPFANLSATADYAANSAQSNVRDVTAILTTGVQNVETASDTSDGLQNGTATLSDNVSIAEARGNLGSTAVDIAANATLDASSALMSTQVNDADVSSNATGKITFALSSDVSIPTSATVKNSNLSLEDNQLVARSVSNDVTNVSRVAGTNIEEGISDSSSGLAPSGGPLLTQAVHLVNNGQASSGLTTATADGSVTANLVASDPAGTAVSASTVALNGNVTAAEARGNSASNTLLMDGSASMDATGIVLNAQVRSITGPEGARVGSVEASATGNVNLTTMADLSTGASAFGSSLGVNGNVTQAVASANSATNSLTALAGAGYGSLNAAGAVVAGDNASVAAAFGVLNAQSNDAAVKAKATASYGVDMLSGVQGSALNASNNQVIASAVGNTANNGLVLSALPGNVPSAGISSSQVNTGAISAIVTGTSITLAGGSSSNGVVGSSLGVRGNTISAAATGNSVVNTIKAR